MVKPTAFSNLKLLGFHGNYDIPTVIILKWQTNLNKCRPLNADAWVPTSASTQQFANSFQFNRSSSSYLI